MISKTTRKFRACLQSLPDLIRRQAKEAYRLFREDPHHPGLNFKQVHPSQPIFSARVGLHYRAVCVRDGDVVVWFWIGSHSDYDKLLVRRHFTKV